jgi:hypothetical protein
LAAAPHQGDRLTSDERTYISERKQNLKPASIGGVQVDGAKTCDLQGTYCKAVPLPPLPLLLLVVDLTVLLLFCFPPERKSPSLLPAFELLVLAAKTFLEHPTKPCRHTPTSLSLPPAVSERCMSTCADKSNYITGCRFYYAAITPGREHAVPGSWSSRFLPSAAAGGSWGTCPWRGRRRCRERKRRRWRIRRGRRR